jgi:predicted nucleotidyltransferase
MKKDVSLTALSILLAASGVFWGQASWYGYILVIIGFLLFGYVIIQTFLSYLPRLFITKGQTKAAAEKIYAEAAEKGGIISCTHIFPKGNDPDIAEKLANVNPQKHVDFNRIMIMGNQHEDYKNIVRVFNTLSDSVSITLNVLSQCPLHAPRLVRVLIPRINLLLYKRENIYTVLIGLDSLDVLGPEGKRVNFGLLFRSKRIYQILEKYFDLLLSYGHIVHVKSIQEYQSITRNYSLSLGTKFMLDEIGNISEVNPEILHVGVFGSVARCLLGLTHRASPREHEADVDLLIVISDQGEDVKGNVISLLNQRFPQDEFNLIVGPDEKFFYEWRASNKINVDIEIVEKGSPFYEHNQLLGRSIFAHYYPLYSFGEDLLCEYLQIPLKVLLLNERRRILLNDRKGLVDFSRRLETSSEDIDPRRVVSLIVRNITWAESGQHPCDSHYALVFLSSFWDDIFRNISFDHVKTILDSSDAVARNKRVDYLDIAKTMVSDGINFLRK